MPDRIEYPCRSPPRVEARPSLRRCRRGGQTAPSVTENSPCRCCPTCSGRHVEQTAPKGRSRLPGSTAASASNSREIDLYVALEEGVYRYEPVPHALTLVSAEDLRALAIGKGQGKAGAQAAVRLIFVVDIDKFSKAGFQEPGLNDPEVQKSYYFVDTGIIAANIYLFAASQGLAAWFHNCDKAALSTKLKLRGDQRVLFGQTVGYLQKASADGLSGSLQILFRPVPPPSLSTVLPRSQALSIWQRH